MSSSGGGAEKLKLCLVRWNINFFGILCSTTHSESFQIASAVFDSCKSLHQIEFFSFVKGAFVTRPHHRESARLLGSTTTSLILCALTCYTSPAKSTSFEIHRKKIVFFSYCQIKNIDGNRHVPVLWTRTLCKAEFEYSSIKIPRVKFCRQAKYSIP